MHVPFLLLSPMTITPQQPHGALRSYGRIKARPIKARQAELLETVGLDPAYRR